MNSQMIDKELLKAALEEMLRERNPELRGLMEDILAKFIAASSVSDRATPLEMTEIRKKYALRKGRFVPFHKLLKDTPPAVELTKRLRK